MSLYSLKLQSLLLLLESHLEQELEMWTQYWYLLVDSETETEKAQEWEKVLAKRKVLTSQLDLTSAYLSQLEKDLDLA